MNVLLVAVLAEEVVEVARVHQHDFDHRGVSRFVGRSIPGGPIELTGPPGATGRLATGDRIITDADERTRLAAWADGRGLLDTDR